MHLDLDYCAFMAHMDAMHYKTLNTFWFIAFAFFA